MVKRLPPVLWPLLVLALLAVASGAWILHLQWSLPWSRLPDAADSLPLAEMMVQNNTLPRMAMAVLAGGTVAAATLLLQQVLNNPLASDGTLAVSAGAQTALAAATVFAPALLAWGNGPVAFAGAAAALAAVLWLSARRELVPLTVILSGLVVGLYLASFTGVLMLFFSEETRGIMQWGSGSLVQDSWQDTHAMLWRLLPASAMVLLLIKPLNILDLGDDQARALGVNVRLVRLAALALAAFAAASVVGLVGMMGFLGLAAATLVRQLGVRTLPARLAAAFASGALLLLVTDNLLMLLKHYQSVDLPAGAVAALTGAPLLLWLMMKAPLRPWAAADAQHPAALPAFSPWLRRLPWLGMAVVAAALFVGRSEGWHLSADWAYFDFRWPRVLLAASVGVMLALTGVVLQRLTHNPMASPELLGVSAGTALGGMAAMMVFNITYGTPLFWLFGMAAALLSLGVLLVLNRKNGLAPEKVLLTGMALAALTDALIRVWTAQGDFRVQLMLVWMSGTTYYITPPLAALVGLTALLSCAAVLPLQRWLGLLGLDAAVAQSAGVNVRHARTALVLLSAVLTAFSTLLIGPLTFVGLLAPHLASLLGARLPRQQLAYAAAIGATVMVLADWIGRQLLFPYEIPAGVMATLLGGMYFMFLMRQHRPGGF